MPAPSSRVLLAFALAGASAAAGAGAAAAAPEVGSPDTATADPPVARPGTSPCAVELFSDVQFADFSPRSFSYAPPADCAPPWAAVVLEADFSVTAGRQFDRTASIWIGGANIYFGTTAEPSAQVSPTWHIERDLTDYTPLFAGAQPGEVDLDNLVDSTFTGVISGSARLLFYPTARHQRAPVVADAVLPLAAARPTGGPVILPTGDDRLAGTFSLPTNIERAYLDVYAQSQSADEFWYSCVPDDVAGPLQSCGGNSFREAEITIDGTPAGVAPVFPWLFTGAIDPFLWRPIPGVQTLAFEPYRVDLTPFAGVLSDGQPHEVAVAVLGANNYFSAAASLLLYLDRGSQHVTGAVLRNTLDAAPVPHIDEHVETAPDGSISASIDTRASRCFAIAGAVQTSHGRVETEVVQTIRFSNRQTFAISAAAYVQDIAQATSIEQRTRRTGRHRHDRDEVSQERRWPLSIHFAFTTNPDQTSAQTTEIRQRDERRESRRHDGHLVHFSLLSNAVSPADTLLFDAAGTRVGQTGQSSSQSYFTADSDGRCYSRDIAAAAGVLTEVTDGAQCGGEPGD
jgi:hypothetical protein